MKLLRIFIFDRRLHCAGTSSIRSSTAPQATAEEIEIETKSRTWRIRALPLIVEPSLHRSGEKITAQDCKSMWIDALQCVIEQRGEVLLQRFRT